MILLPAIDLIGGKVVRLTRGDYGKSTVYGDDPLAVAKSFRDAGRNTSTWWIWRGPETAARQIWTR